MAHFTIKEMLDYKRGSLLFKDYTFLIQDLYEPPEGEDTDTRPEWIKEYVDVDYSTNKTLDDVIGEKYGDYIFTADVDDVEKAYTMFYKWNGVYLLTHQSELMFVYKSYTEEFNPRENYDRHEDTTVSTDMSTGGVSKTAPDDSETFYNVGSADSTTEGDVTTTGHIHGNIGVVDAPTMAQNVIKVFGGSGWFEYFVDKLIKENCILVC